MIGRSIPRVEDAALVSGEAEFADDAPLPPDAGHACFVRSPWPHAEVVAVDAGEALGMDGVHAVLTGADAARWSDPLLVGVRAPVEHRCLALDRVRYAGEPVAVVVARDRYVAEDAAERVQVEYAPLPAVVDPEEALGAPAPVLHEAMGTNLVHERSFRYGDPEAAFRAAPRRVEVEVRYPRNVCTPIEGIVVTAAWLPGEGVYEVHSNFQGPYSLHPVMARSLRVPVVAPAASRRAEFGRELRCQAVRLRRHRRPRPRGPRRRTAGALDAGPDGEPLRLDRGHQPRDPARGGGRDEWAGCGRSATTRSRTAAPTSAPRSPPPCTGCTAS